jgi:hypothetical protein
MRAQVGHVLAGTKDAYGYVRVKLCAAPGKHYTKKAHHVVAEAFIGPRPDGLEVNHINGVRDDNRPENLEYVTHLANVHDAVAKRNSYSKPGERNPRAKLTWAQVNDIRARLASGERQCDLARAYQVDKTTMSSLARGETWR